MNFKPLHADSQCSRIIHHLARGRTLTPVDALRMFGCFRLGGRIYDLKRRGHKISRKMVELANGAVIARYKLDKLCRARV